MKIFVKILFSILLPVCLALGIPALTQADRGINQDTDKAAVRLTILPFANYSDDAAAESLFLPLIESRISSSNIEIVSHQDLRNTLRKYRIRAIGLIGADGARQLSRDLDIDYILIVSFDIFIAGDDPEAALTMRLIDPENMNIIWAETSAATGRDFSGLFGIGQVKEISELARRLVDDIFRNFVSSINDYRTGKSDRSDRMTFAIVPFDNLSDNKHAGFIITGICLTGLINRGYRVIEPGMLRELFLENNLILRGRINLDLLGKLHSQLNVDRVITGSVGVFNTAPASNDNVTPKIELSGRCLDAAGGKILTSYELSRTGSDSEKIFNLGSYSSLGRLAVAAVDKLLDKLDINEKQL